MSFEFVFDANVVGQWVCEKAGGQWKDGDTAIGVKDEHGLFVGVVYDGYTGASIAIHSRCDNPAKVPRKFYWMIFDYPFNQLKVKRITGIVSTANEKAQRVDEHLGFKREAILRDYFLDGDAIIYVMTREDCRFLRGKYVQRILSPA